MKKEEILNHLRAAKDSHIRWVRNAKLLVNGMDIDKNAIPIDHTGCKFGQWFYKEGQMLNGLPNNSIESMKKIEDLHSQLHDTYLKIFNIFFSKKKGGFFSKLFGFNKKKINEEDLNKAKEYLKELEQISKELVNEINILERRIIALPEEKIENLI